MPTVIDSFIVELGLDPKKFTKGQADALAAFKKTREGLENEGKGVDQATKKMADSISSLQNKVLGLTASFFGVAAVKGFISNLSQTDAALGRTSFLFGQNIQDLAKWELAVKRIGGTTEGAASTIGNLVGELQNITHGLPSGIVQYVNSLQAEAQRLGLTNVNLIEAFSKKGPTEFLLQLSEVLSKLPKTGPNAAFYAKNLGIDEGTLNLLIRGRGQIQGIFGDIDKIGTATKESAAENQRFIESWGRLDQAITSVGRDLEHYIVGPLTNFNNGATSWIANNKAIADSIGAIGISIGALLALKPAVWVLRLLGLGGVVSTVGGVIGAGVSGALGAAAPAAALLVPTNKSDEPDIYKRNPKTGKYEPTEYGRSIAPGATPPTVPAAPGADLRIKPGAGVRSPAVDDLATMLQRDIPGLNRFTAFDDRFHTGFPSAHARGQALDFTINDPAQSAAVSAAVEAKLRALGVSAKVLDEYKNPSSRATAGHIHVQFESSAAADAFSAALRQAPAPGNLAAGAAGAANVSSIVNGQRTSTTTTSTKIDNLNVITRETTGPGIGNEIKGHLERQSMAAQANYGAS